ncbi:primosomal protein N' [Ostreibacterium oceani]|uniref:Replication restart protein PriA n=1 Tax=Ostreibacterium oceani TaxID=2654998 RepID=A0A6N7EWH9_9GAMM|nr:primosomal protein N' [Ostreibacterium oceani]MPV86872.1 primosomal protein N' [Ostreibacterium oceani]
MIAEVLLPIPVNQSFDYRLPESQTAVVGQRVLVALGTGKANNTPRQITGIIVAIKETSPYPDASLKPILALLDSFAIVDRAWLDFIQFTARYYAAPLAKLLINALPKHIRSDSPLTLPKLRYYQLTESGISAHKTEILPTRATKQRALLRFLHDQDKIPINEALVREQGFTAHDITTAVDKGYATYTLTSPYHSEENVCSPDYQLTGEQQALLDAITTAPDNKTHLIYGVTGSGKTEIYLQLIEKAINTGQQVLLLIPEISLTPQMLARFHERFGNRVAALHSGLGDKVRADIWLAAMNGDLPILIGTRSAIFTPFQRLGLIIVDEEHDLSYKQQEGIPYHARDLARYRAHQHNIPIVLGSATPSLESLYQVKKGHYQLHQLVTRATQATQPTIHLIDRRGDKQASHAGSSANLPIAEILLQKIRQTLQRQEQALVFLNRRGFSPVMMCRHCDWKSECPTCDAYQTAHTRARQLHCHLCGYICPLPTQCPQCGQRDLIFVGHGTEKLETQLQAQFPHHHVLRLDRDKQTTTNQLHAALEQIHNGDAHLIVGTQLIVKGHHFPNVTTVCVVDSDQALFSSDFRAEERLLQQLTQVAGRAGRESQQSHVYIQTTLPTHPVFAALQQQDYLTYANNLLAEREKYELPPHHAITIVKASALDAAPLMQFLRDVKALIDDNSQALTTLGPAPSPIERLKNRFQAQLFISAPSRMALQRELPLIEKAITHLDKSRRFRAVIDVDAMEN